MADDITDGIADAIIGAVFLFHKVTNGVARGTQIGHSLATGMGMPKDLTPKPGTEVFQIDPDAKPAGPVRRLPSSTRRPKNDSQMTEQYRQESAKDDAGD